MTNKPSQFVERSHFRGFLILFRDWGAIFLVAAFSIWANNIFVYLVSVWIIGIFQFAIGESILHEASHYNLFKIKSWNENLEFLYALPFFKTVSQYQSIHVPHHQYLGKEGDHLLEDYEDWGLCKPSPNLFFIWFVQPLIGLAGLSHLKTSEFPSLKVALKLINFWLPVILIFYFLDHLELLFFYWIIPLFWCFTSYLYWSEIQDHYNTTSGTRSNLGMINNILTHNNGYHYMHHSCPTIPWYKLPEAHQALCLENSDISSGFFDTYQQMKQYVAISKQAS